MGLNRVLVTQETSFNFAAAESFGEITFLTRDDLNNIKGSLHNESLIKDIGHKLQHFDSDEDWILVAGSPYVAAVVFMLLGWRGIRNIKILRWDNRNLIYVPMIIELPRGKSDE
jgi:hypothetical protein